MDELLLYKKGVKFVIESMIDLWEDKEINGGYSFMSDLVDYSKTIQKENILDEKKFANIVADVLKEKNIQKGTLT